MDGTHFGSTSLSHDNERRRLLPSSALDVPPGPGTATMLSSVRKYTRSLANAMNSTYLHFVDCGALSSYTTERTATGSTTSNLLAAWSAILPITSQDNSYSATQRGMLRVNLGLNGLNCHAYDRTMVFLYNRCRLRYILSVVSI